MCDELGFTATRPSNRLCTDNGVMIGWDGIERFTTGKGIYSHESIDEIEAHPKCQLGESFIDELRQESILCKWVKVPLLKPYRRCS